MSSELHKTNSPMLLPLNTFLLKDKYSLQGVLGAGGFGITYKGYAEKLRVPVAIKEYYPKKFVYRSNSYEVLPLPEDTANYINFETGKKNFLREAQNLAKFSLPGIVWIKDYFEEFNTAYIVMEYIEGTTLEEIIRKRPLAVNQMLKYMKPIIESLGEVHEAGVLHMDISPDNIMITKDGSAKLIDFGASYAMFEEEKDFLQLKHGYAPLEQYQPEGHGTWTDVYAICATMYHACTGVKPPKATERTEIPLIPPRRFSPSISKGVENAIIKGLSINSAKRFKSTKELYDALYKNSRSPKNRVVLINLVVLCTMAVFVLKPYIIKTSPPQDSTSPTPITSSEPPVQEEPLIPFEAVNDIITEDGFYKPYPTIPDYAGYTPAELLNSMEDEFGLECQYDSTKISAADHDNYTTALMELGFTYDEHFSHVLKEYESLSHGKLAEAYAYTTEEMAIAFIVFNRDTSRIHLWICGDLEYFQNNSFAYSLEQIHKNISLNEYVRQNNGINFVVTDMKLVERETDMYMLVKLTIDTPGILGDDYAGITEESFTLGVQTPLKSSLRTLHSKDVMYNNEFYSFPFILEKNKKYEIILGYKIE